MRFIMRQRGEKGELFFFKRKLCQLKETFGFETAMVVCLVQMTLYAQQRQIKEGRQYL